MKMPYEITARAEADLQRIYAYGVHRFGRDQADRYLNKLFDRFELIAENPSLYQRVDHVRPGYRRCVVDTNSIYYRASVEHVQIIAVVGRQNVGDEDALD